VTEGKKKKKKKTVYAMELNKFDTLNRTLLGKTLRHPWYLPRIYHGLELGFYIRGITADKSIYKPLFDNNRTQLH